MKGWILEKPNTLVEKEISEVESASSSAKVKITKTLLTLSDVLRYSGNEDCENVALGSYGIGIVSETDVNLLDLEQGKHVFIEALRSCEDCNFCKDGDKEKCSSLKVAGADFNGFLMDFKTEEINSLYSLPESVDDFSALFIGYISNAIAIVDKLNIQKGDYVAIVGANNFGNILAQLLMYYQAVPIVCTQDDEDEQMAKDAGVYYVLGKDDNWAKEVSSITGGRLADSVVYISDCNIPAVKAFSLAAYNASVAFTGLTAKSNAISFSQAIKKKLVIYCVNSSYGNTAASINLLANKAINVSYLKIKKAKYLDTDKVLSEMADSFEKEEKFYETIIENN